MKKAKLLVLFTLIPSVLTGLCSCNEKESSEEIINTETKEVLPATIRGKVLSNDGDMMVAGIIITDENNNRYRTTTNAYGGYNLHLAPGTYELTFTKGFEFTTYTTKITVETLKTYYLRDTRLAQVSDAYATGWVAGDTHQHTVYSDGSDSIESAMVQNAASGIYWGFLTDHNTSRGVPEWRESNVQVYKDGEGNVRSYKGFAGSEITSEFGHFNSLGTGMTFDKYEICFRDAERGKEINSYAREKVTYIAEQTARQNAYIQMNHPYSLTNMGLMNYIAEDDFETINLFDTMEIWNAYFTIPDGRFTVKNTDNQNYTTKMLWYSSLNHIKDGGKFVPATAGTDNHDATGYASGETRNKFKEVPTTANEYQTYCRYAGKYAGCVATYAYLGEKEVNQDNVLEALTNGNSYLSNGPILNVKVNGKIFGETVNANNGEITFDNDIFCQEGISEVRYVKNGEVIKSITLNDVTTYNEDVTISGLVSKDWVLVEVLGDWGVYAISNPVFVA